MLPIERGKCGDNLNYTIYDSTGDGKGDYVEVIGKGEMDSNVFKDNTLITSAKIDNGVTSIGNYAFSGCSNLSSISIADGVTGIGDHAFGSCTSLSSIILPESVTSIDKYAFYKCSSLESIVIPDGIKWISISTFSGCSNLSSASIPDSVTSIGNSAFYGCVSLKSIEIPDGLTSLGEYAFYRCSCLNTVSIPDSITSIGKYAFGGCSSLIEIYTNKSVCEFFSSVSLGDDWQSDQSMVVSSKSNDHSYVENVITQGTDRTLGTVEYKCSNCGVAYQLNFYCEGNECSISGADIPAGSSLKLPKTIDNKTVIYIGSSTFYFNYKLCEVVIPEGVKDIYSDAFSGCINLRRIEIPEGVTGISSDAFVGCKSLSSIVIPEGVTKICDGTFNNCRSLCNISIPASVTSIGNRAFLGCDSLKSIHIPSSVVSIGYAAVGMYYSDMSSTYKPITDFVIYGVAGSKAESYASENGITFSLEKLSDCRIEYCLDGGINNPDNPNVYTPSDSMDLLAPTKTGYIFEGWYLEPAFENKITALTPSINTNITLYAKWEVYLLDSYQVSLSDSFDLKYIMKIPDSVVNDDNSYMEFNIEGEKQQVKPSRTANGSAVYYCEVPAKQIGDKITARLYVDGMYYDVSEYTLKEYFDTIIENKAEKPEYALAKDLAISILNYGSYCQLYFGYKTDKLVNADIADASAAFNAVSEQTIIDSINATNEIVNTNSVFGYIGASFTCLSNTCLNMYFANDNNITADAFEQKYNAYVTGISKSNIEYSIENGYIKFTVKSIPVAELDNTYSFVIKSDDSRITVEYCPLVYIQSVLCESKNSELKDLCKALYLYSQEANSYFDKYIVG